VERRSALKTMAGTVGGLISLPAWATGWTTETVSLNRPFISRQQETLLAFLTETIIPKTDTPGARELNVHQFIQKVVADCYDKATQAKFQKGLDTVDELAKKSSGKAFSESDPTQQAAVLTQLSQSSDPDLKSFYSMVKGLTIKGYLNSEYVMTNLTNFQFMPGHYYGCVPVPAKTGTKSE
jgi:hypothetical protein